MVHNPLIAINFLSFNYIEHLYKFIDQFRCERWFAIHMVNQLLFATTLFRDLLETIWFATSNFYDQVISIHLLV